MKRLTAVIFCKTETGVEVMEHRVRRMRVNRFMKHVSEMPGAQYVNFYERGNRQYSFRRNIYK